MLQCCNLVVALQVQLEALAVQKKQFQEQLAEKDAELCVKDRQILQLHHSERELIGQVHLLPSLQVHVDMNCK